MFTGILINFLGSLLFLFLFWRKLKEDYQVADIFTTSFILLGIASVFFIISKKFFPVWWFWFLISGISLGLGLAIFKYKFKFYESLEALTLAFLPWLSLVFLVDSVKNGSVFSLGYYIYLIGLLFLGFYLAANYKKIIWYKSGRVGFAGLFTLAIFFLVRAAVALLFPFMLSFVGKIEVILSGILAFIFFLMIYNLSRKVS